MKLKQLLTEDARTDIQSKLQRMPLWKKYEMTFDIPGWVQPNKMKTGTTKDGRKTYTISIGILNAPDRFWQEEKSVKLIQKYFPEYKVVGKGGVYGGIKSEGTAGWRTYTFISNNVGESTTQVVHEDVKADIKSKIERLPIVKKYDLEIEDKVRTFTNRNTGKKKYVLFISFPLGGELSYGSKPGKSIKDFEKTDGGSIISKAIKRALGREYDVDYSFIIQRHGKYSGPHSADGKRITVQVELFEKGYY
jgi:hypothetical protein